MNLFEEDLKIPKEIELDIEISFNKDNNVICKELSLEQNNYTTEYLKCLKLFYSLIIQETEREEKYFCLEENNIIEIFDFNSQFNLDHFQNKNYFTQNFHAELVLFLKTQE